MKKSITILLPCSGYNPVGGFKVVYEYANRLSKDGFSVHLIYPATLLFKEQKVKIKIRMLVAFFYRLILQKYSCRNWFKLEKNIYEKWVPSLNEIFIPKSDLIIATAWETAEYLSSYRKMDEVKKMYLIQSYELWSAGDEIRLQKTWKAPFEKIVIAPWLQEIADSLGERSTLIENGFDFEYFNLTVPIESRDPYCLCMLYHTAKLKGCDDGFKAIEIVKTKYPQLKLNLFGSSKINKKLPEWIRFYHQPDRETHNNIYNEAAIFVGPSHVEGFSLTPPEAMQCGCAVVCTDIGGYTVVCKDNDTALVSPPKNPEALAVNIIRLIEDQKLRIDIAKRGNESIKQYTWDRAYLKLKKMIEP